MAKSKSKYTTEIAEAICEKVATGSNLHQICSSDEFPSRETVYAWLRQYPEFSDKYARARELRSDVRADRIDSYVRAMLTRSLTPEQCRVAIDAEKWQAGKENPRRYGDRLAVGGTPDGDPIKSEIVIRMVPSPKQIEGDDD